MAKSVWLTVILILFQFVIISEMASVDLNEKPIELESRGSGALFSSNTFSGQHPSSIQYSANNMVSVNVTNCQYGFMTPDALFETNANTWALKYEFGDACLFPIINLTGVPVNMNLDLIDTLPDPMHFQEDWNFTLSVSALFSNGAITILDSGYIHQSDFIFSDDSGFISNPINLNQYTTNWNGYDIGGWRLYTMTAEQILPNGGSTFVEYSFWALDVPPLGWEDTDVSTGIYPTYFSKPTEDWADYNVTIDHGGPGASCLSRTITQNTLTSNWQEDVIRGKTNQTVDWYSYGGVMNLNITMADGPTSTCFYGVSGTAKGIVDVNLTVHVALWDGNQFNSILNETEHFTCLSKGQGWIQGSGGPYNNWGGRCEQQALSIQLGGGPTPLVIWNNSAQGWTLFTPIYQIQLSSVVTAYEIDTNTFQKSKFANGTSSVYTFEVAIV